jgi:hypothetical protein
VIGGRPALSKHLLSTSSSQARVERACPEHLDKLDAGISTSSMQASISADVPSVVEIETTRSLRFNIGMKTDLYTKVVLTVIAACLLGLVFRDAPIVTTANAETATGAPIHVIIDGVQGGALPVANARDPVNGYKVPLFTQTFTR